MKGDPSIMDILNEIYQTVDNIVQRRMEQSGLNNQIQAIVLGSSNGKYIISVNGAKYSVRDGVGINPQPNTPVWVCVPSNDWNKAYICAGKGISGGGSGNVDNVYQNGNSVLGEDHIARIRCATPEDIEQLQANFQDGVEAIGNACTRKGSTPASSSLEDTVAAIDAIQTGGNYATLEVNEDGTYVASEDPRGIDAYDIVVVSKDVGQPHTVVFYGPDGSIIQTQANVPYHGYASCTLLDGTVYQGQYFKGWNPHPTDIVRDTFCYPQYGDYIIQPGEIPDDWVTICAKGGSDYPLGSFKPLVINGIPAPGDEYNKIYYDGNTYTRGWSLGSITNITVEMYKVAEGEDGSSSTWLSSSPIFFDGNRIQQTPLITGYGRNGGISQDWGISICRRYLNEFFINYLPNPIQGAIKSVTKQYTGWANPLVQAGAVVQKTSIDKIWIPSVAEMETLFSNARNESGLDYRDYKETSGIDYTSVYMPIFTDRGGYDYQKGSQVRTVYPITSSYWDNPDTFGWYSYTENDEIKYASVRTQYGYMGLLGFCL